MYITVRDRPTRARRGAAPWAKERVAGTVVLLGIVSMLTDISSESVNAVLPIYITSVLGMSALAYGFIDGIYQGVSALVRILGGWVSDRADHPEMGRGRRLPHLGGQPGVPHPGHRVRRHHARSSPPTASARGCAPRRGTR